MIELKLYKYNSQQPDYKGLDLSKYLAQGNSYTEDITQELDVGEITLYGFPQKEEFDPSTKFIYEIWENGELKNTIHLVCDKDMVSMPQLSDSEYYDHHISMIEPSVIAQKRTVDNISTTYKLKYVNLNLPSSYTDEDEITSFTIDNDISGLNHYFGTSFEGAPPTIVDYTYGKYFALSGNIQVQRLSDSQTSIKHNQNIDNYIYGGTQENPYYKARFILPHLQLFGGVAGTRDFQYVGDVSIDYTIKEYDSSQETPTNMWTGSIISNHDLSNASNICYNITMPSYINEWVIEYIQQTGNARHIYFRKYTDTTIENAPSYSTQVITIVPSREYEITITLHNFEDNIPSWADGNSHTGSKYTSPNVSNWISMRYVIQSGLSNTQRRTISYEGVVGISRFLFFDEETEKIIYQSSTPYSALDLLKKAIINSGNYRKRTGGYSIFNFDPTKSVYPFYIDPNFEDELASTQVIENFYNQKNLWEIMLEVGYYIHAVPEIKFGEDDKFLITFNRLGETDLKANKCTKQSIYNFRGIEDYISACSSYVNNMVQLDGEITEWVAPKTSSENYLIANDTCNIQVSKPIIELLSVVAKRVGSTGTGHDTIPLDTELDLTSFIFEESIYNTLGISKSVFINKGVALYYKLANNKIEGCQYQLPTVNTGDVYNDYAIKKVIWSAYAGYDTNILNNTVGWTNVKVNDYIFKITYRTQDNVRLQSTRPDLRKYLLSSKYDQVPQQVQFNNQQDILVDSIKFGNNVYGKLIRTGNTNYKMAEWTTSYDNIKHKGELYEINNALYYVSKVKHTIFSTHIISDVEYAKDYNQLSQVVGIPSEPRFYEISEQSSIRRDVSINEYIYLGLASIWGFGTEQIGRGTLLSVEHLSKLMFANQTGFSKFMLLTFKGDKDKNNFEDVLGDKEFRKDILLPINAYSSGTTLTYEVDCVDNYSAGDKVVNSIQPVDANENYNSLLAERYTDKYGKSALLDFYILDDIDILQGGNDQKANVMALPESPITTDENDTSKPYVEDYASVIHATNTVKIVTPPLPPLRSSGEDNNLIITRGGAYALVKDNREAISVNYNLQLITGTDQFVISPFVFLPNKQNVKIVLLNKEVNKLTNGYINISNIIVPKDEWGNDLDPYFNVSMTFGEDDNAWGERTPSLMSIDPSTIFASVSDNHFEEQDDTSYERVRAIAIICNYQSGSNDFFNLKSQFAVARNIPLTVNRNEALREWIMGCKLTGDRYFKHQ